MKDSFNKIKKKAKGISRRLTSFMLVLITAVTMAVVPATQVKAGPIGELGNVFDAVGSGMITAGFITGQPEIGLAGIGAQVLGSGLNFYDSMTYRDTTNFRGNKSGYVDYRKYYTGVTNNYSVTKKTSNYFSYNPVTNQYYELNETNNFQYNIDYNTYYYENKYYYNNYNYTYNNYVTNNYNYVSYYIIENNDDTGEVKEYVFEIYFELPDGRNSYYLNKEDVWGIPMVYDYTQYENIPEDDGTTLGLWHLDGDTKDSSSWNNTAGSSYTTSYKDGRFEQGKYFGDSGRDFLELKLDKSSFDASEPFTLEWVQYSPSSSIFSLPKDSDYTDYSLLNSGGSHFNHSTVDCPNCDSSIVGGFETYKRLKNIYYGFNTGFSSINGQSFYFDIPSDTFVFCSLVFNGSNYVLYVNGNQVEFDDTKFGGGIDITNNSIKFYSGNVLSYTYEHGEKDRVKEKYDSTYEWEYNSFYIGDRLEHFYYIFQKYWYSYINDNFYNFFGIDTVLDEVRLSKGVLYFDNYIPSSSAYTTNMVLVTPDEPTENMVAFKTQYEIGEVRYGGARPTYPSTGDIYISLDDDEKVEKVQQYQESGWYEITGSIYYEGKWTDLSGFDLANITLGGEVNGDSDDSGGSGNGDDPQKPDDNNSDSGIWDSIAGLVKGLFDAVATILSAIIDGLTTLINNIVSALSSLSGLTGEFGNFLQAIFVFIPKEIIDVIVLGVTLCVFAAVIKMFL